MNNSNFFTNNTEFYYVFKCNYLTKLTKKELNVHATFCKQRLMKKKDIGECLVYIFHAADLFGD